MWQILSGAYKDDREQDGGRQRRIIIIIIIKDELKRGKMLEENGV